MKWCKECREFHFTRFDGTFSPCKDVYQVREVGGDDDSWDNVRARNDYSAAETWTERYDEDEHEIAGHGSEIEVEVRAPGGTVTRWTVSGEVVARYSATKVE